jgi:ABC-type sugar transport system ATPase subunit
VIGLLGRNGAGKSTLMECLLGLRESDAGSISLFGEPLDALCDATRARIGYVLQKSDLFEWMTPTQMLAYFKALYPRWNDARVEMLLARSAGGGRAGVGARPGRAPRLARVRHVGACRRLELYQSAGRHRRLRLARPAVLAGRAGHGVRPDRRAAHRRLRLMRAAPIAFPAGRL